MKKSKKIAVTAAAALLGAAATGVLLAYRNRETMPAGAEPLKNFEPERFMGLWYEIARMPLSYEKDMHYVTAEYSMQENGSMRVVNMGYNEKKKRWQKAIGKAVFVNETDEASMKIAFLGPFYSGYNVVDMDEEYKYALVFGRNLDYMWILSRETTIPEEIERRFLEKANDMGYDLYRLIWTEQEVFE